MDAWIPLLQTLVWPVFITGLIIAFRRSVQTVVAEIAKRIGRGEPFEVGTGGVKFPARAAEQDQEFNLIVATIRDALRSGATADLPREKLAVIDAKITERLRERAFLTIDSTRLPSVAGGQWQVSYYQYRTVSALLDDIWATIGTLPNLSFGTIWVLEVDGRRLTDQDIGRRWAAMHGKVLDDRPLDHPDVGIKPGMQLKIVPASRG